MSQNDLYVVQDRLELFEHDKSWSEWTFQQKQQKLNETQVQTRDGHTLWLPTLRFYFSDRMVISEEQERNLHNRPPVPNTMPMPALKAKLAESVSVDTIREVYKFCHTRFQNDGAQAFKHRQLFENMVVSLFGVTDVNAGLLDFRFVDLDVLEGLGLPHLNILIPWKLLARMKQDLYSKQMKWFQVDSYTNRLKLRTDEDDEGEKDPYYYQYKKSRYNGSSRDGFCLNVNKFEGCQSSLAQAGSSITAMLEVFFDAALFFELDSDINECSDLEYQAMHSNGAKSLLSAGKLKTIFDGLKQLPFEATRSACDLLNYLSLQEIDSDWMAMLLKMGLFLTNVHGKMAWLLLVQSVLSTWEVAFKFRVPSAVPHNIYYGRRLTMGTCVDNDEMAEKENDLDFRDIEYLPLEEWNISKDLEGDYQIFFGVLSQLRRDYPEDISYATDCFQAFTKRSKYRQGLLKYSIAPPVDEDNHEAGIKTSDLQTRNYRLEQCQNIRPVKFGQIYRPGCARISFLYRFYCFSTTTGPDHLFYCGPRLLANDKFYHDTQANMPKLTVRSETLQVLNGYINHAYKLVNILDRDELKASVQGDIKIMKDYWDKYHGAQDTIVMCLEIQQRYLYDECRLRFTRRVQQFRKYLSEVRKRNDSQTELGHHDTDWNSYVRRCKETILMLCTGVEYELIERKQYIGQPNAQNGLSDEKLVFVDIVLRDFLLQHFMFEQISAAFGPSSVDKLQGLFGFIDDYEQESLSPIQKFAKSRHLTIEQLEECVQDAQRAEDMANEQQRNGENGIEESSATFTGSTQATIRHHKEAPDVIKRALPFHLPSLQATAKEMPEPIVRPPSTPNISIKQEYAAQHQQQSIIKAEEGKVSAQDGESLQSRIGQFISAQNEEGQVYKSIYEEIIDVDTFTFDASTFDLIAQDSEQHVREVLLGRTQRTRELAETFALQHLKRQKVEWKSSLKYLFIESRNLTFPRDQFICDLQDIINMNDPELEKKEKAMKDQLAIRNMLKRRGVDDRFLRKQLFCYDAIMLNAKDESYCGQPLVGSDREVFTRCMDQIEEFRRRLELSDDELQQYFSRPGDVPLQYRASPVKNTKQQLSNLATIGAQVPLSALKDRDQNPQKSKHTKPADPGNCFKESSSDQDDDQIDYDDGAGSKNQTSENDKAGQAKTQVDEAVGQVQTPLNEGHSNVAQESSSLVSEDDIF